jgi:wobble nucleotide-excising tRNase
MQWLEDWEYPNDHIYAMERQHDIEVSWQQWEEEQERNKRLPAIIIVEKPTLKDEAECNTRTIRRAHQEEL